MKGVSIDEFCNFQFVSGVKFSPAGTRCLYVQSHADLEANGYKSYLYELDMASVTGSASRNPISGNRKLTSGGKEASFLFLDEDTILFSGNREENKEPSIESRFYRLSLTGGEAELAYTFPIPVSGVKVLTQGPFAGDFLLMGSTFPGFEDLYTGNAKLTKAYLDRQKAEEDYEVVLENPWWWNGGTYTKGVYQSLFRYDAKKKKLIRLTDPGMSVSGFEVLPGEEAVYFYGEDKKKYTDFDSMNLYRLDLSMGEQKLVFESGKGYSLYDLVAGENFAILLLSDLASMGSNSNPDFYKLNYPDDSYELYCTYGQALGSSVGSDVRRGRSSSKKMCGDVLYFVSTLYDGAYLMKLEDGKVSKVLDKEGSVDGFDIYGGNVVLSALFDMKAPELYDGAGKQLTHNNDKVLRGKYLAKPERCDVMREGYDVHGFVLKPMNFDPDKKYPVILDIHGGPKTVYGEVYYHEMQYWAGLGYFVIFCNPTGSDGRGDEFADICGKYGTVDYEDIMAFVDQALANYPQMDADHVYETGGSYGGFMTNWIIGHTDRFKAVATQRSISNWFSFYGVSDIGVGFTRDQNRSTPWENPEKLWFHSPMKYYDRIKTPTLIIHSLEDYRCPVDQAYQLYASLCERGIDSKMVLFKGENHDLSRSGKPQHRIRRIREITEWFEKHQ